MWFLNLLALLHIRLGLAPHEKSPAPQFIVWNVGQGEWLTLVRNDRCLHFDIGGESIDWSTVERTCANKFNLLFLSHWDWDHISFAREASRRLGRFCVARWPRGPPPTARKENLVAGLANCSMAATGEVDEIGLATAQTPARGRAVAAHSSNEDSRVYEILGWFLAPGDSTVVAEKTWTPEIHTPGEIRVLILGHHGSRTSTSNALLAQLPDLRAAVATARFARYGHPHEIVRARLLARGVALLRTEDWGNIRFELPNETLRLFDNRREFTQSKLRN